MTRISDVIERANDELQETLSKAEEEDDLSTLAEIYDEIGHKADKYANIFSTATKSLNGESDTDEVANEVEEQMDEEADGEAPRVFAGRQRLRHPPQLLEIDHADRQDCAELDEDLERVPRRYVEVQQFPHQDHVPGR